MKILFITHETTRTGSPKVLLLFLQWINAQHPEIIVDVLALRGGALEGEFKIVCHSYYSFYQLTKLKKLNIFKRVLSKLKLFKIPNLEKLLVEKLAKKNYNLIYANSIPSLHIAATLKAQSKNSKLLLHLHELEVVLNLFLNKNDNALPVVDKFIAASGIVKTNLINNWNIPKSIIEMVYECSNIEIKENGVLSKSKKDKVFTIGASGNVHWRKGPDIFLQVARYIFSNYPNIVVKFVWVGKISFEEQIILEEDIHKLNLKEKVLFTGEVENPSIYFNDFDVFVMTSREDPFPLVCIEVGMLGKPIICFKGATGSEEIIKDTGGFVVPYLDIEAMSGKIIEYYEKPELIKDHGVKNEVAFSKFTPELICPKFFSIIQRVIVKL